MRYLIKNNDNWWEAYGFDEPLRTEVTVDGPKIINTGLLDKHGNQIHRTPPPIGFGRMKEW